MRVLVVWSQEDSQLYRAQGMHTLLEELNIEHGYRELEGVGHESGRIYPFSAMVSATWPCPVPVASQALLGPEPDPVALADGLRCPTERGVGGFVGSRWGCCSTRTSFRPPKPPGRRSDS